MKNLARVFVRERLFVASRYFIFLILILSQTPGVIAASNAISTQSANEPLSHHVIPGELLVKYKTPAAIRKADNPKYKARSKTHFRHLDVEHWRFDASQNVEQIIRQLKADPEIEIVEPNLRRYARKTITSRSFHEFHDNRRRLEQIDLPALWDIPVVTQEKVRIAVLDDAFYIDHPDIAPNIDSSLDTTLNFGIDTDPSPENCEISEEHGTMVLGIVGALRDDFGLEGASDNAALIPIRMSCYYTLAAELRAYDYAISSDVDIINISWGGPNYSELEREAILKLASHKILVIAASGNYDMDNDLLEDYPSGLDLPNMIVVAATTELNELTPWTQYGQTKVDIAAPGENFETTVIESTGIFTQYTSNQSGTSFSAPMVAGVAASLLTRVPGIDVTDVKGALLGSARAFPDGLTARLATDGYVNAMDSYLMLQSDPKPVPIINNIQINDSQTGNGNGQIDPDETVFVDITLENIWADASYMVMELSSPDISVESTKKESNSGLAGVNRENFSYSRLTRSFPVRMTQGEMQQDIRFTLTIDMEYGFNQSIRYTREFTLDAGKILNNESINNTIRKTGNDQDDAHYYFFDVVSSTDELVITLETGGQNLDLLVKRGGVPQFDYLSYSDPNNLNAVDSSTLVASRDLSDNGSILDDKVELRVKGEDLSMGVYHIVVLVAQNENTPNINYRLTASISEKEYSSCAANCSGVGSVNTVFLFLMATLLVTLRRSKWP